MSARSAGDFSAKNACTNAILAPQARNFWKPSKMRAILENEGGMCHPSGAESASKKNNAAGLRGAGTPTQRQPCRTASRISAHTFFERGFRTYENPAKQEIIFAKAE